MCVSRGALRARARAGACDARARARWSGPSAPRGRSSLGAARRARASPTRLPARATRAADEEAFARAARRALAHGRWAPGLDAALVSRAQRRVRVPRTRTCCGSSPTRSRRRRAPGWERATDEVCVGGGLLFLSLSLFLFPKMKKLEFSSLPPSLPTTM